MVPADLPDEKAVYACDMLSTGFAGAENAELRIGETVAIFAQGPVGLAATIGAGLLGAGLIIAVESKPERKKLAEQFGADVVVDFTEGDPVDQILALTDGHGVDAAIEAFGFPRRSRRRSASPSPAGGSRTSATTARTRTRWGSRWRRSAWGCRTRRS